MGYSAPVAARADEKRLAIDSLPVEADPIDPYIGDTGYGE